MKKVFSFVLIAVLGVILMACVKTTDATTTGNNVTTTDNITTVAPVDLQALIDELKTQYADTLDNEAYLATEDLTLVTTVGDLDITWTSNKTNILENDGTIHRPAYADGDQTAILTASITDGVNTESYDFYVTVKALDKSDADRAQEVFDVVTAFPTKEKWTVADENDLDFLTEGKDKDDVTYTVVWASSHPEIISTTGVINQPLDADIVVTMTATITINGVDFTEEVEFTVAKVADGTPVNSIAEAAALPEDTYVEILGVTVCAVYENGDIFFTDGTDVLYIYTPSFEAEVGDVLDITGVFGYYYNAPQLTGTATNPIKAKDSTAAVSQAPVTAAESLEAVIAGLSQPSQENPFDYEFYSVTAKIYVEASWGNYSVFLVPTTYDFNAPLADGATQPNGDSIMIYYKSDMSVLSALHGKEVTLTFLTQGWRTDKSVYYANFFGTAADITVVFDDEAAAVDTALNSVIVPETILENTTLTLPTSIYGVSLTYSSNNEAVISNDGIVTVVDGQQITVEFTITGTYNSTTATRVVTVTVGELQVSDISSIYDSTQFAKGDLVKVVGILTADTKNSAYWLQDETAGINLYVPSALRDAFAALELGVELELVGTVDIYNGLYEITNFTYTVTNSTPALPTAVDITNIPFTAAEMLAYQGQLVSLYGFYLKDVVTASSGNSFNITLVSIYDSNITIAARIESSASGYAALYAELTGYSTTQILMIEGAVVSWYNNPQLGLSYDTQIRVATEAEIAAIDASAFEGTATEEAGSSGTLPLTGEFGSTLTWDVSAVVTAGGTFDPVTGDYTLPSITATTDYTVTLTVTNGTATETVTITLTVFYMGDEDKLAADKDELTISLSANELDTVTLPTTTTYGSVVTWAITSGDATLNGNDVTFNLLGTQQTVVLTATLTYTKEDTTTITDTKVFNVVVDPVTIITDFSTLYTKTSDVWDVPNAETIYAKGIVTKFGYNTLYLQDANGVGVVITGNAFGSLNVGDEVIICGVLEEYRDVRQFDWNPELKLVVNTAQTVIVNTMTPDEVIALTVADTGKLITINSGVTLAATGTYYDFLVTGTSSTIVISTHSNNIPSWFDDVFVVGDTIGQLEFVFTNFVNGKINIEGFTLEQRDIDKAKADAAQLQDTFSMTEDYVLPTPVYGSTFTVTGVSAELTAYVDYTTTPGTLVLISTPASAVTGTVTVDVTIGVETVTVTLNVTVTEPVVTTSDLIISEVLDWDGGTNKAVELYNPTDTPIVLDGVYTLSVNSNANTTWGTAITLTGTIQPGETFVIVNAELQALKDLADLQASVNFNGDDAIGLFKNGTLLDMFGVFAEDPGAGWTVGSGSTANSSIQRLSSVTSPVDVWDVTEWAYFDDAAHTLGTHTVE